jgi:hypothetical protein
MDQPIACSLDATELRTQLDEWRSALGSAVTSVERVDATVARMQLRPDYDDVSTLIGLARREVACCPFFRFAVEIDVAGATLVASVPPEAATVLDSFIDLARA